MIVSNFYRTREDGVNLYVHYSNEGVKIRKVGTGEVFDEAIDVKQMPEAYEETNTPIELERNMATEEGANEN